MDKKDMQDHKRLRMPGAAIRTLNHHLPHNTHDYNLYDVTFQNSTIATLVTSSSSCVDSWLSTVLSTVHFRNVDLMVGLDVERRLNFDAKSKPNPIATLQLCVGGGHRCLVFHIPMADSLPPSLASFLAHPRVTFFGVEIGANLAKLQEDYNLRVANACDLRDLAAKKRRGPGYPNMRNAGLKELAQCFLGLEVEKPKQITMNPWDNHPLSDDQVQYAVVDAFLSYQLACNLSIPVVIRFGQSATMNDVDREGVPIWMRNRKKRYLPDAKMSTMNHQLPETHNYNLYEVTFETNTIYVLVTASSLHVRSWLSTVFFGANLDDLDLTVGLAIESRPNNSKAHPVATLQLCVGHRCLVFQILRADCIPSSLYVFLANPKIKFFGVIRDDVAKLEDHHGIHVANVCDIRDLANESLPGPFYPDMKEAGLKTLARCLLGLDVKKPKKITKNTWDNRSLSDEQVEYAVLDAFLSYHLGRELSDLKG